MTLSSWHVNGDLCGWGDKTFSSLFSQKWNMKVRKSHSESKVLNHYGLNACKYHPFLLPMPHESAHCRLVGYQAACGIVLPNLPHTVSALCSQVENRHKNQKAQILKKSHVLRAVSEASSTCRMTVRAELRISGKGLLQQISSRLKAGEEEGENIRPLGVVLGVGGTRRGVFCVVLIRCQHALCPHERMMTMMSSVPMLCV